MSSRLTLLILSVFVIPLLLVAPSGLAYAQGTGCPGVVNPQPGWDPDRECQGIPPRHCGTSYPSSCVANSDCCRYETVLIVAKKCKLVEDNPAGCEILHAVVCNILKTECEGNECVGTGADEGDISEAYCQ